MLRMELGGAAAVCGKVFDPWTQAYHYFGIEEFLLDWQGECIATPVGRAGTLIKATLCII